MKNVIVLSINKYMKDIMYLKLIILFLSPILIFGCQSAYVATVSKAVLVDKEERSFNNFVEDTIIVAQLKNAYFSNNEKIFFNVSVEVTEGRVLLTGSVEQIDERIEATKLAWGIEGVNEVINEIQIGNRTSLKEYAQDVWITAQVRGLAAKTVGLRSVAYNFETIQGKVYVVGITSRPEQLEAIIDVAKTVKGVTEIVNYVIVKE